MPETPHDAASPLRVVLLAPTVVVGGITTWTRFLLKHNDPDRVAFHVIDTSRLYVALGAPRLGLRGVVLGLWDAVKRFRVLMRAVRRFRPHLVYFTCAPSIGLVARDVPYLVVLKALGVPTVAHLRGGDIRGFFGGNVLRRLMARGGLRTCRAILVITREVERAAREIFGPDRVIYVPNMIDDDVLAGQVEKEIRPAEGAGPIRLLHVAWQAPAKGSLDLVRAIARVQHDVRCSLVGEAAPENERAIGDLIASLGVGERIQLVGRKRGRELADLFAGADLFVFPTHSEGFPNVILEAMTYGVPIIASDVGAIGEMIGAGTDDPAGLLLERTAPADPVELAAKIDRLIADHALRGRLGASGRQRVRACYLASVVVPQVEALLEDLARPDGPQGDLHWWGRADDDP